MVTIRDTDKEVFTQDDGSFVLSDLAAGAYSLTASKDGYGTLTVPSVLVTGGATTDLGSLNLAVARATARLSEPRSVVAPPVTSTLGTVSVP